MSPPNVLLIVFDTARRDAFEPYGAPAGATAAAADMAGRGHAYPHAYANSSWTLPSHASMFTGLLPRRLGLTQAASGLTAVRSILESHRTRLLPVVLSAHGYDTRAWVTNLWVSRYTGFDIGFDSFEYVNSGRHDAIEALVGKGRAARVAWAREGIRSYADDGARELGGKLRASIAAWDGTPTFWFVNLTECHSPYLPPRPWNDLPVWERARAALDLQRHLNFLSICLYLCGQHRISPAAMERMRHLYRRAISYMDDWLGSILGALDARGILDETLVILTSDHGENFGEQGLLAHGFSLDQRLINVPLVMAGPGLPAVDAVISLADIPRVVVEAAGIGDSPYSSDELPTAVAVAQHDPLAAIDDPRIQQFAKRYGFATQDLRPLCTPLSSVADADHKLVVRGDQELLYDLTADPGEANPIEVSAHPEVGHRLREALRHPASGVSTVGAPEADADTPSTDELEAIARQMRLLGYM